MPRENELIVFNGFQTLELQFIFCANNISTLQLLAVADKKTFLCQTEIITYCPAGISEIGNFDNW